MSHSLSRWQAVVLGLVVLASLGLGGYGVARIADKQGLWADSFELRAAFPEAHDVTPGTPVRLRGVEVGKVLAVEYPPDDRPGAAVTLRLELQAKYAGRLYNDATAQLVSSGLLGSKVVAIAPGTPAAGPLASGEIRGLKPFSFETAAAELTDTARDVKGLVADVKKLTTEATELVKDVRTGDGTLGKLVKDDDLYRDLKGVAHDAGGLLKRADGAVGRVDGEMDNLKGFVQDGRDTLKSVKAGTDALGRLPIIRGYVEDSTALLVRPTHKRERMTYFTPDLFPPGTAVLSESGKRHLVAVSAWLQDHKSDPGEVVVVAYADPADRSLTAAAAREVTKKQAEAVIAYLKGVGADRTGRFSHRKMTALGMGQEKPPVPETEAISPANVQVLLFTPE